MRAEFPAGPGFLPEARGEAIGEERDHDRSGQHEQQAHVTPLEERQHDFRLHHRREREAEAENGAGEQHEDVAARAHANLATRCAVTIAVARNVHTARIDGTWSEAIPQMPWPAVHPLDMRAPKPAMNPPAASCQSGTCVTKGFPRRKSHSTAPRINPAAYTRRQRRLPAKRSSLKYGAFEMNDQVVVKTVLMPPINPVDAKSRLIPKPSSTPPAR